MACHESAANLIAALSEVEDFGDAFTANPEIEKVKIK